MCKIICFLLVFVIGEILFNLTWYRYLKSYFLLKEESEDNEQQGQKKFLFLNLSTFKGIFERFIISVGLILGIVPIIIVFATIKLGTRFDKTKDIKNDYFLIGNLSSILIAVFYHWVFNYIIHQ